MSLGGFPGRKPGTPPGRLSPAPAFIELTAGVWFEFHVPRTSPILWRHYLDGAEVAYRRRGVESALELDLVADGRSTSIFAVAREPDGQVVAGVRFQGPLLEVDQAHVSLEFAGSPGEDMVRDALAYRIPAGVTEFKAGWVADGHRAHDALSDGVARCFVHGMRLLGARHGCCSAGAFATRRWESSGGRAMPGLEPVPYPNDRYQTTLLWWDLENTRDLADRRQWRLLSQEAAQLDQADDRLVLMNATG
jgi:hypothetical protein